MNKLSFTDMVQLILKFMFAAVVATIILFVILLIVGSVMFEVLENALTLTV